MKLHPADLRVINGLYTPRVVPDWLVETCGGLAPLVCGEKVAQRASVLERRTASSRNLVMGDLNRRPSPKLYEDDYGFLAAISASASSPSD